MAELVYRKPVMRGEAKHVIFLVQNVEPAGIDLQNFNNCFERRLHHCVDMKGLAHCACDGIEGLQLTVPSLGFLKEPGVFQCHTDHIPNRLEEFHLAFRKRNRAAGRNT